MSHTITPAISPVERKTSQLTSARRGRLLLSAATVLLFVVLVLQILDAAGIATIGLVSWRPLFYAYIVWSAALCAAQVMIRGEAGQRAAFVLPAVLFTVAMVVFPTVFGLYIAFTDWNLSAAAGRRFNGLDNLRSLFADIYFWNALLNMVY
jgi:multiple sugar transport system permease protein